MAAMTKVVRYIARGLFSLIFLFAGAGKLMNWQGTVDALSMKLSNWYMHLEGTVMSRDVHEFLMGSTETLLGVATFLEILGGLLLLFGIKVRWGAFFLLLFLVPVTVIFHAFWFEIGADRQREMAVFLKNLALIGALLYFLVGPQPHKASQ
ncbi:MAG: DoxX family membrane protein [Chlamydiia bacterium]|nr:DoxX family membrane protein [Chlamydiia bacterium]